MLRCFTCYETHAPWSIKNRSFYLVTKKAQSDCACRRICVRSEGEDDKPPVKEFHRLPYAARENGGTVWRAYPQLPDMPGL